MATKDLFAEGLAKFKSNIAGKYKAQKDLDILQEFYADRASATEVIDTAKGLQTQVDGKYSSVKVGGTEVIPGKWIDRILGNVNNFVAVGDFLTKGAPESVGMTWLAVKLTLSAIQSNYQLYGLFGSGLSDITEVMVLIKHYGRLYDERHDEKFKGSEILTKLFDHVRDTYAAILDFSLSVKRHLSGGKRDKLRHAFKDFFGVEVVKFQGKLDAISALKQKVIEASDAAFEEKTFQRFGEVGDAIQDVQKQISIVKEQQEESRDYHQREMDALAELQKGMESLTQLNRPRTRWEWAKDEFDRRKKTLNPLPDTRSALKEARKARSKGTCQWIFEDGLYKKWIDSSDNSLLCLTGSPDVGKSVVVGAVVDRLEGDGSGSESGSDDDDDSESDSNTGNLNDPILLYVSCDTSHAVATDDQAYQDLSRVTGTLIYQLYEVAAQDPDEPGILEECNKVFTNPKQGGANSGPAQHRSDTSIPELANALKGLITELERDVVIVLDAVDLMNAKSQMSLFESVQELLGYDEEDVDQKFLIFVSCRSDCVFINHAEDLAIIDVEDNNNDDIATVTRAMLGQISGLNEEEQQEACDLVIEKAGHVFRYVTDVAIPHIKQPFQRPLKNHLLSLPVGFNEIYDKFLQNLAPNYVELLRVALMWVLYAKRPIKAPEIMQCFQGVYAMPREEAEAFAEKDDISQTDVFTFSSSLEIEQLKLAAGPFLKVSNAEDDDQTWITVKDPVNVRKYLESSNQDIHKEKEEEHVTICARCQCNVNAKKELSFTEKQVHLDLAIRCVRTLNNPVFQKRFKLPEREENQNAETADETAEEAAIKVQTANLDQLGEADKSPQSAVTATQEEAAQNGASGDETEGAEAPQGDDVEEDINHDDCKSMESADEEDEEEKSRENYAAAANEDDWPTIIRRGRRYEIMFWVEHVKDAETLWTPEERAASSDWATLMRELDILITQNKATFQTMEEVFDRANPDYPQAGLNAIHFAAYHGLTSWVTHLLDQGHDVDEEVDGVTPLWATSAQATHLDMLKLLCDRGANLLSHPDERSSCFVRWVFNNPSVEVIRLLMTYKPNLREENPRRGWTVLHMFFEEGKDVEAFNLLMNKDDPNNQPDINALDWRGETPLHALLRQQYVPQELLKATIDAGADINIDDNQSRRPLQNAAHHGDLGIIRILLESGKLTNINDGDHHGWTALHQAAWTGQPKCIKMLLEHGAEINISDKHDRSPFFQAIIGKEEETAKLLLDLSVEKGLRGTEINKVTRRGRTPLRQLVAVGYNDLLRQLLGLLDEAEAKEAVNKVDTLKGIGSLQYAAFRGNHEAVKLLLEHGADAKLETLSGKTALMLAYDQWTLSTTDGFEDTVVLLVERDPIVAAKDNALQAAAAIRNSKRVLEILHKNGADFNIPDEYGWTPVMLAKECGNTEAENFLRGLSLATRLPSRWIMTATGSTLSDDGLTIDHTSGIRRSMSTDRPIPAGLDEFYYEITSVAIPYEELDDEQEDNPILAVGFCTFGAKSFRFPGWPPYQLASFAKSWAYHGDDGGLFHSGEDTAVYKEKKYSPGDVIGCGIDLRQHEIYFTLNGELLDSTFTEVTGRLFPIIGLKDAVRIETNFGDKPFTYQKSDDDDSDEESSGDGEDEETEGEVNDEDGDDDDDDDQSAEDNEDDDDQEANDDDDAGHKSKHKSKKKATKDEDADATDGSWVDEGSNDDESGGEDTESTDESG